MYMHSFKLLGEQGCGIDLSDSYIEPVEGEKSIFLSSLSGDK